MESSWRGIVQFRENEDKRPLWQRRTEDRRSAKSPAAGIAAARTTTTDSGSTPDSCVGSTASRSSSADENPCEDHQERIQNYRFPPVFPANRSDDFALSGGAVLVARSNSFREFVSAGGPPPNSPIIMGGYSRARSGSPYTARQPAIAAGRAGPNSNAVDQFLTADYVPKGRPDRRFSTPAVPRFRGSVSRSPSPRYVGKKGQLNFDYFRNRAGSLPASNGSLNATNSAAISNGGGGGSGKRRRQRKQQDNWPQTRSPSRVEQRFLELSESADYDKIRTFVIGTKGELVERGFCYRHRSSSSSPTSSGPMASPNEDAQAGHHHQQINPAWPTANAETTDHEVAVARYSILVIGASAVGKSSLLRSLKKSHQLEHDYVSNSYSVDSEMAPGSATVVPVLICGEEVHLTFYEFGSSNNEWTSTQWQAAVVMYSISDKRSFSAAADILYKIRAEQSGPIGIPIVLVANKIDLERHRQVYDHDGVELAKSYDCRFLDVSVELNHRVEDALSHVMGDIWRCTVYAYRQRQMSASGYGQPPDSPPSPCGGGGGSRQSKRFSLRLSKMKRNSAASTHQHIGEGKPRSSRARSLHMLPPASFPFGNVAASNNVSGNLQNNSRLGFLNRLFGRRAVQSCEDLFSRLLRG